MDDPKRGLKRKTGEERKEARYNKAYDNAMKRYSEGKGSQFAVDFMGGVRQKAIKDASIDFEKAKLTGPRKEINNTTVNEQINISRSQNSPDQSMNSVVASESERKQQMENQKATQIQDEFNELSFSDAFAKARQMSLNEFNWRGLKYNTELKAESLARGPVGKDVDAGGFPTTMYRKSII